MGNGLLVEYITTRILHAFTSFSTVQIYVMYDLHVCASQTYAASSWFFLCRTIRLRENQFMLGVPVRDEGLSFSL